MATPFFHTTRALQIDSYYAVRIGLIVAMGLLLLWLLWFFRASVSLYEQSEKIRIDPNFSLQWRLPAEEQRVRKFKQRKVHALFPQQILHRFQANQKAWVYLDGNKSPITARVTHTTVIDDTQGLVTVEVEFPAEQADPFLHSTQGKVEIEVARRTPADLSLHIAEFGHPFRSDLDP